MLHSAVMQKIGAEQKLMKYDRENRTIEIYILIYH